MSLRKIIVTILLILSVAGIFFLTLQSPKDTVDLSMSVQRMLHGIGIDVGLKALRHYIHYFVYFIFGVILFLWKSDWWVVFVGFLVGLADECLKIWLPTREFDYTDLLRDFVGIVLAFAVVHLIRWIWKSVGEKKR